MRLNYLLLLTIAVSAFLFSCDRTNGESKNPDLISITGYITNSHSDSVWVTIKN